MTLEAFLTIAVIILVAAGVAYFFLKPSKRIGTDILYADALALMIEGKNQEAVKLLKTVVKSDTEHVNAYLHLGNLLRESNTTQAIKIHQSLVVRPKLSKIMQVRIFQALARDHLHLRDYKRAKREADQVLSLEKHNLWALEFKLKVAELQEDWDGAFDLERQIQKVRGQKDSAKLAGYLVRKGEALARKNDRKGAESSFRKAIKMAPDYPESYFQTGNLFEFEGNLKKAVDYWEAYAERAGSESVRVYDKIESSLYELGRFSDVEEFYSRMIEINPGDIAAMIKLATVYEAKGETDQAVSFVEEALDKNPDSLVAQVMKIRLIVDAEPANRIINQLEKLIEKINSHN